MPPFIAQGLMQKRRWKDYKRQRWWMYSRNNVFRTLMQLQIHRECDSMHKTCTDTSHTKSLYLKETLDTNQIHNLESIHKLLEEETKIFSMACYAYQPHSITGLMPKSSRQEENRRQCLFHLVCIVCVERVICVSLAFLCFQSFVYFDGFFKCLVLKH